MAIFMSLCGLVAFIGLLLVMGGSHVRGSHQLMGLFMILAAAAGVAFAGSQPYPVPFGYFLGGFFSLILLFLCVTVLGAVIAGAVFLWMKFRRRRRTL